ncbi:type II toxin-antitoxin system PemK/MazF family toxin [Crocosphaera watsonii]|uniref:type II toxin-antitoxin system PemK/MazF family toxin n=1 Tax=Crocosphaera watsonii TaxID=263511 RepID=UPI001E46C578|nr:type II toxin-antitoxin system PemK/MazF family toxin [Crocosphaera watsonii]
MVCALTTNLRRARAIGNVLLNEEEGNLPEKSVVNVSQIFTVDKRLLSDPIGKLSEERINEIIAGIKLVLESQELV